MTVNDDEAFEAFQAFCAPSRIDGRSAVDELIAERRADAAREEVEVARDERRAAGVVEVRLSAPSVLPIPPEFLAELGWHTGDVLLVECDGDSLFVRRAEENER